MKQKTTALFFALLLLLQCAACAKNDETEQRAPDVLSAAETGMEPPTDSPEDPPEPFGLLEEIKGNNDLSSILKSWATNGGEGSLMRADGVLNVLLLGIDAGGANADAILLVSVNQTAKRIFLTSVMRDSFTYVETETGGYFGKINSAYGSGGAECLRRTVENDLKIRVDHCVAVDFEGFSAAVDAMGGVEVPVQEYETHYIDGLGEYGEAVLLNGAEALQYCRMRYSDSDGDVSRTRRQRQLAEAVIKRCRTMEEGELAALAGMLLLYVQTEWPAEEILSLGKKAIAEGWADYETESLSVPTPDFRMDYRGRAWVWIVDYPPLAQYLQDTIYGETNVRLERGRVSAIDVMQNGSAGEANP